MVDDRIGNAKDVEPCMSLYISDDGKSVELVLDTSKHSYLKWIDGEGGDIGLLLDRETHRVIGVHLPLYQRKLIVDGDFGHGEFVG